MAVPLLAAACGGGSSRDPVWSESSLSGTDDGGDETTDGEPPESSSSDEGSSGEVGGSSSSGDAPGEFSNIARITKPASVTDLGGGQWSIDEQGLGDIGHAFFAEHPDDYDFLAVYTEGDMPEVYAFAYSVQYDVAGIGFDISGTPWITPADVGSAGRLLQINMMNTPKIYDDPNDASILVHETTHHFAAFIELPGTPEPAYLLDDSWSHFNIHVDTGGPSATGYGDLVDLGGGAFRFTVQYPLQLSPLELYLAGMIPPADVPPMFYVRDAYGYDPAVPPFGEIWTHASYSLDATYSGTRVDFTVDDVVAANGVRTPAFGAAKTDFRVAFAMVCIDKEACDPADLAVVEAQRTSMELQFPTATGSRASVDATL